MIDSSTVTFGAKYLTGIQVSKFGNAGLKSEIYYLKKPKQNKKQSKNKKMKI
jgi:hypothetical protein